MDRRNWPWKKKSSDKTIGEKLVNVSDSAGASLSSLASLGDQENYKKVNYVQIPMDVYRHLNGLGGQVNTLTDQIKLFESEVKNLKEQLSAAHSEISAKDSLVIQHAKVAEEAVSGWEKVESENLALKRQLESVTLLKLTAEDRTSHLDGALKECMRQIRNVKDESEHQLHEVVLSKTSQWDKIKLELQAQIADLDQRLLRAAAENAALSRSLQERSNLILEINEKKSQAEAEIEYLKGNILSKEKEINALKYDLHVASKELDIRNEEKNMSVRSAEIANKQHLEGVKKIAKLEAECQRLRGLVRKKLPGPAALAQMRLEVEHLDHEVSEPRKQRTLVKNHNPESSLKPELSSDTLQHCQKENECLTTRVLTMEGETKMLREALANRNSELQASRDVCAKMAGELKSLKAQTLNQKGSCQNADLGNPVEESSRRYISNSPIMASMSADGNEGGSSSESCAPVTSDFCQQEIENISEKSSKPKSKNHLGLLDDFLEMERLAANDVDGSISISTNPSNSRNLHAEFEVSVSGDLVTEQQPGVDSNEEQDLSNVESSEKEVETGAEYLPLFKLRSRIYKIFESQILDSDIEKIVEDIKCAIQEIQSSSQQSLSSIPEVPHKDIVFSSEQPCIHYSGQTRENQISVSQDREPGTNMNNILTTNLASAISRIHKFVLSLVREAILLQDTSSGSGLSEIDDFSTSVHKFTCSERGLVDFVLKLSHVLYKVTDMNFLVLGFNNGSRDVTGGEYIDKVTLLENKVVQNDSSKKTYSNEYHQDFQSCSDAEVAQDGKIGPGSISNLTSCNFMEKLELLKLEKDNMGMALAICTQKLDNTKLQVQEKEQLLTELKVRLASSQKLYSLAETKLKCMTESYKSLEVCTQELEAEVNLLREKKQKLEIELSEEKHSHQHALARCADLQDKIQRNKTSTKCSSLSEAHSDLKAKQERERADAAEKLAACQETIYLLGKQLQALHPHTDIGRSQYSVKLQMDGNSRDGKPNYKCSSKSQEIHFSNEFDTGEMDSVASTDMQWVSEESVQYCNSTSSPSDFEAIHSFRSPVSSTRPNHTLTKSSSSSSSSALEEEKISHGISRFFSLKGKNEH